MSEDKTLRPGSREERASMHAPYIMERIMEGATYTKIAEELGIGRTTLYWYRQTDAFNTFRNTMIDNQLADIAAARNNGDLDTAMRYREGLIKIAMPKKIEQTMSHRGGEMNE